MLHLEREMRPNGFGAPDEVTLIPLNKIEPTPSKSEPKQADNTTQNTKKGTPKHPNCPNAIHAANPTKRKIVGKELTLPTIRDLSVTLHENEKRITPANQRQTHPLTTQKTNYAAPALWGNS